MTAKKNNNMPMVRALQSFSSPFGSYAVGDVFQLPAETCRHWIDIGYVEIVK